MCKKVKQLMIIWSLLGGMSLCSAIAIAAEEIPVYKAEVVNAWPHDSRAFTQGLAFHAGQLYEGTGRNGQSSLRRIDLESGELLKRHNLASRYFGEGIAIKDNAIYQLTWRSHIGFIYDLESFSQQKTFFLPGEGWGITHNDESLIISDGSSTLRFLDTESLQEVRRVEVTHHGNPVTYLNELEFIRGEIWANIWYQDIIVRIDPDSGKVNSIVDLSDLFTSRNSRDEVLNGIAWDEASERLFVTGKLWPTLFEIEILD